MGMLSVAMETATKHDYFRDIKTLTIYESESVHFRKVQ